MLVAAETGRGLAGGTFCPPGFHARRGRGLLCCLLSGADAKDFLEPSKLSNPIFYRNLAVVEQIPEVWRRQLLFQTYRLGLPTLKPNTLTIALGNNPTAYDAPVISIGREDGNDIRLSDSSVSRRHGAIVNYLDDVWVYDLGAPWEYSSMARGLTARSTSTESTSSAWGRRSWS